MAGDEALGRIRASPRPPHSTISNLESGRILKNSDAAPEPEKGTDSAKARTVLNDPAALSPAATWALNVCSSVGLIMVNKAVLQTFAFRFVTTLTALHYCVTAGAGVLARRSGQLSDKRIPFWTLFWFSLIADGSVVTMNLSLMTNSVGFYQIAKLSIIPTCCLFEALLHAKTFSWEVRASVVVVMVGVGICTITDMSVNAYGFAAAAAAVVTTTLQQIYVGQLQKVHKVGSFDLLSQTAPLQAVCLIATGPFIDYILVQKNVFSYPLTGLSMLAIVASCILALFVNLSTYLCIGKFSVVTFQVLGHMKTVLVLLLGWLLFDTTFTIRNLWGMAMAVVGMVLYSWAVEVKRARNAAAAAAAAASAGAGTLELESKASMAAEEGAALLAESKQGDEQAKG